ncbi:hypothetical protein J2S43_002282 [Catenuloplanes nepalensis]|uniref:HEAT repeat domain-containing protein n=1 Tax=Catenuloplanes nepalensis TaxID=587533 RepID=A0ABT9MQT0_9ACTN|nr:hypothetical protein [Catenuloplanes nepalensis]MDP9793770.1 hypothetical protein [Catenuloplanes nepalensis]
MLERLDSVAWGELEHAYGAAGDVPGLIRELLAPDAGAREKARRQLYGNIFHQGSRYEASAYAAPFLLELLADPRTPDRPALLGLLTSLAIGYDESWLPEGFPAADYRGRAAGGERLLRQRPRPDAGEGGYEYWMSLDAQDQERLFAHVELAVHDAVRAGVPLFCALLGDPDPGLRAGAAYALAWFGEDAAVSGGPLSVAATDAHPAVAATALVALGLTGVTLPAASDTIRAALGDEREVVRWGAAIAAARLHGADAGVAVAAELLAWTGTDRAADPQLPYLDGDLSGYAGLALFRQLGGAHTDPAFDALLARIPSVSGPEALPVVGEALRHAFPDGPISPGTGAADLTPAQRRLLQTLADSPATWQWHGFGLFANLTGGIHAYGLPATPDAMRDFLT